MLRDGGNAFDAALGVPLGLVSVAVGVGDMGMSLPRLRPDPDRAQRRIAVEREGEPLPPARHPRFVAPVEAGRTIRGVRELRFLHLGPDEDPQDYEELGY